MTKSSPVTEYPPASSITVLAPAKINLILRILDRRADGFHNLWSLMQTVGLEDEIVIRLSQQPAVIALKCDSRSLKADHANLVYRAAAEVLQRSPETLQAFADRISFICFCPKSFARKSSRAQMLARAAEGQRPALTQRLSQPDTSPRFQ